MADAYQDAHEREFSAREIFMTYVLANRLLWAIAAANAFVYLIRYGVLAIVLLAMTWKAEGRSNRARFS